MDLVTFDKTSYQLGKLVEHYDSLIWTERFLRAGEFQLKTARIEETLSLLPLDSYVTLKDTNEVAIVETHLIETNEKDEDVLTVSGRTFESILEGRVSACVRNYERSPTQDSIVNANVIDLAFVLITRHINDGVLHADDVMDNVYFGTQNSLEAGPSNNEYAWKRGQLYNVLVSMMEEGDAGLRSVRHGWAAVNPGITIQARMGLNRTVGQSTNTPVYLRYDAGHLGKTSSLFTRKGRKNIGYIVAPVGSATAAFADGTGGNGENRRDLWIEASDITEVDPGATVGNMLRQRAREEVRKTRKGLDAFEGEVAPNIPYKYKTDYDLGDRITVKPKYGGNKTMIISEYIRSEDSNGERAYPTLSSI